MGLFFALKSLNCLAQNGRVSKAVASAVGMLGISIYGKASDEGTLEPIGKCRGEKKVISSILKEMENIGYCGGKVRISHVENAALAQSMASAVWEQYPRADIVIYPAHGLCSYYAERGGLLVGCER